MTTSAAPAHCEELGEVAHRRRHLATNLRSVGEIPGI